MVFSPLTRSNEKKKDYRGEKKKLLNLESQGDSRILSPVFQVTEKTKDETVPGGLLYSWSQL